jgi:hypothetical protein
MPIQPSLCPRYLVCGAPVCPLDADWQLASHLPEERVCRWLTELAKPGGAALLEGVLDGELLRRVVQVSPGIVAASGVIRNKVLAASRTGSRIVADRKRFEKGIGRDMGFTPPP